jgi:diguanylate cyclase (GGDEF)-like protein
VNDSGRGIRLQAVTQWALWQNPAPLRCYVAGVIAAAATTAAALTVVTTWRARDLALFGTLAVFCAVVIEMAGRAASDEPAGIIKEIYAAWYVPTAVLLPPVYGLAMTALTFTLAQARIRRTIAHRRVFSAAASGLALAAVSAGFRALPVLPARPAWWLLAAAGCGAAWLVINAALVATARWLADRTFSVRDVVLSPAMVAIDVGELAAGVLITAGLAAFGPVLLGAALPLVIVLQRLIRAAQLDTRVDPQTSLLYAAPWRDEAEVQLALAQARPGAALAVGIIHLDNHGTPNAALLASAASIIRTGLRSYDRIGRFSPQEIIFMLPAAPPREARQIAERMRASLASSLAAAVPGQPPARVIAAIGVATTTAPATIDLTDLQAVAVEALAGARQNGPGHICIISATPEDPSPEDAAPDVEAARKALGALLRAFRKQAGMTQEEVAAELNRVVPRDPPYARVTITQAEAGRGSFSATFWATCDLVPKLKTNGRLRAEHARIAAKPGAQAEIPVSAIPADAAALTGPFCPSCGLLLQITAAPPTGIPS